MKKDAKSKKKRIQAAEFFEFPPDVVLHGVNLHIFENAGCVIECYTDILSYTQERIRVQTKIGGICLEGEGFSLEVLTADSISVTGRISKIIYEDFA